MSHKTYLGDSVYADFDGFAFVLTTENGLPTDPSNRIVLEPREFYALAEYVARIKKMAEDGAL